MEPDLASSLRTSFLQLHQEKVVPSELGNRLRTVNRLLQTHPPPSEPGHYLLVCHGTQGHYHILSDRCRIGRQDDNDVVIESDAVSGRHCRISFDGEDWLLSDQDSRNGTWLNGRRVDKCYLGVGDCVQIANHLLVFIMVPEGEGE